MFERQLDHQLRDDLQHSPAVALLGPRQVGKTTLALQIGKSVSSIYLDLQSERDRNKLAHPELYLSDHLDKLVILDEIHRVPALFAVLRGLIDRSRRAGRRNGLYLLLGSASIDLLKQSGESLAGRISYLELHPLNMLETPAVPDDSLWLRGGFPDSLQAASTTRSLRWRNDFIRTYLERDIPQFSPRIPAQTLRRFWTMLAHNQAGLLNVAQLARNLAVDAKTANGYIDLLCDLLLVRKLPPWHSNAGKRLVKSPKVYVRDCGLLHALLDLPDKDAVLSHPVVGASWEGFVVENLLSCAATETQAHFYRSSGGAEVDLMLTLAGGDRWAIEIKRSLAPKVERGFYAACVDLAPARRLLVYPGTERYRLGNDVEVIPLRMLCEDLRRRR